MTEMSARVVMKTMMITTSDVRLSPRCGHSLVMELCVTVLLVSKRLSHILADRLLATSRRNHGMIKYIL